MQKLWAVEKDSLFYVQEMDTVCPPDVVAVEFSLRQKTSGEVLWELQIINNWTSTCYLEIYF